MASPLRHGRQALEGIHVERLREMKGAHEERMAPPEASPPTKVTHATAVAFATRPLRRA